ncbi:hypothetical protein NG793_17055 [Laspinema sp. C5]|uniref:Uncharacterized protein n=1 Tax=Laspinema olomoucense D3b TaxID=2953688 RepID=A0ABT2NBF9_9CYAN|nr:hypothetical protein [Laspinema sp. D3b]MCT7980022.1 hypothetical protein [Laspinema sp. D3b]MCT7995382.1 hypothetical protein [Laspinema sp. D3c]
MYQWLIAAIASELEAAGIYTGLFSSLLFLFAQLCRKTNPSISVCLTWVPVLLRLAIRSRATQCKVIVKTTLAAGKVRNFTEAMGQEPG